MPATPRLEHETVEKQVTVKVKRVRVDLSVEDIKQAMLKAAQEKAQEQELKDGECPERWGESIITLDHHDNVESQVIVGSVIWECKEQDQTTPDDK